MKVLQTLGRHKSKDQEGIFQYYRSRKGVHVDASIGRADTLKSQSILITNKQWAAILRRIENAPGGTFRLTRVPANASEPPYESLYNLIAQAVPKEKWAKHDSWLSYVSAILEHEGSVDIYGGVTGPIVLSKGD